MAENVEDLIGALVAERQRMRWSGETDRLAMEANRLALGYWQRELARLRAARRS